MTDYRPLPRQPEHRQAHLTRNRRRRHVENDEYAAFLRRVLRAYGRRIANGDIDAIAELNALFAEVEAASAAPSSACGCSATPGPTSATGSASPARPPTNAGQNPAMTNLAARPPHRPRTSGPGPVATADDVTTPADLSQLGTPVRRLGRLLHPIRLARPR